MEKVRSKLLECDFKNEKKYFLQINRGYHETVTMFYIRIIADAIRGMSTEDLTFDEFIEKVPWLMDRHLLFEFYSDERINDDRAKFE
jgi:hypothetical protein